MTKPKSKSMVEKPSEQKPKPQTPKKSAKPVTKTEAKQPNLFGGEDEVYNVLQLELTRVDDEIKTVNNAIETKQKKRDELVDERSRIKNAIRIMEKAASDAKAKK